MSAPRRSRKQVPAPPVPVNLFSIGSNQLSVVPAKGKVPRLIGENKSLVAAPADPRQWLGT